MAIAFQGNAFQLDAFQTAIDVVVAQTIGLTQDATGTVEVGVAQARTLQVPFQSAEATGAASIEQDTELAVPSQSATAGVEVNARISGGFQASAFQVNAFQIATGGAVLAVPSQVATASTTTPFESDVTLAVPAQAATGTVEVTAQSDKELAVPSQVAAGLTETQFASVVTLSIPSQAASATVEVAAQANTTIGLTQSATGSVEVTAQSAVILPLPFQHAIAIDDRKPRFIARRMPQQIMVAQKTAIAITARRKPSIQTARRAA